MSLILAGLIVAGTSGAVAVGRWLSRRRESANAKLPAGEAGEGNAAGGEGSSAVGEGAIRTSGADGGGGADGASGASGASGARRGDGTRRAPRKPPTAEGPHAHLAGFPCQLGDVLMRITGEEAWLAGGLVLSEESPVSALFVAPDAGHDCAIYVRPRPREALFWMEPLDPGAILVGGEPPSSVEHGGIRFDRVRRLPLRPRRIGVGAPDVGDAVILAEYASAGSERLLVMRSTSGTSDAYRGEELEPSAYEVIASGRATLDD